MLRFQFLKPPFNLFAYFHDVRTRSGGNGNAQRRLAVISHRVAYRSDIVITYFGNISQAELVILMALYNHIANLLYLAEFVIDSHAHAVGPVVVISGIIDAILPLQRGEYLRRRNAQCRHTFRQHLNVDALLSFSVYSDTSHVFNVCQLPLDQSGIVG